MSIYGRGDSERSCFRILGDLVRVNEDEIKRARDYSNLFGPGIVLPNVELKSGLCFMDIFWMTRYMQ